MDLAVGTGINMLAIYPIKLRNALRAYTLKQWQSSSETIIEVNESDVVKKAEQLIQSFKENEINGSTDNHCSSGRER